MDRLLLVLAVLIMSVVVFNTDRGFDLPECHEDEVIGWVNFPPEKSSDLKCVHPEWEHE